MFVYVYIYVYVRVCIYMYIYMGVYVDRYIYTQNNKRVLVWLLLGNQSSDSSGNGCD